jgi:hypothetical protein
MFRHIQVFHSIVIGFGNQNVAAFHMRLKYTTDNKKHSIFK